MTSVFESSGFLREEDESCALRAITQGEVVIPYRSFGTTYRSRNDGTLLPLLYLLTPWCRVLLEQLTGLQLVKKFLAFHGTPRFITALTDVRHLSLC